MHILSGSVTKMLQYQLGEPQRKECFSPPIQSGRRKSSLSRPMRGSKMCFENPISRDFQLLKKSMFFEWTNNSFLSLKFSGLYLFICSRNLHRYQLQATVKGLENSYHSSCAWRRGKNTSSTAGAKGL